MLKLWYKEKIGGVIFYSSDLPIFTWSIRNSRAEEERLTETLIGEKMRRINLYITLQIHFSWSKSVVKINFLNIFYKTRLENAKYFNVFSGVWGFYFMHVNRFSKTLF